MFARNNNKKLPLIRMWYKMKCVLDSMGSKRGKNEEKEI